MKKRIITILSLIMLNTAVISNVAIAATDTPNIISTNTPATNTISSNKDGSITPSSLTYEYKGFIYSVNSENDITITGYKGSDVNINIPSTIDGKTVKYITNNAFSEVPVETLYIPETICNLKYASTWHYKTLKAINVSPNSKYMSSKDGVLYCNETLIKYPENKDTKDFTIPSFVYAVTSGAFYECNNLNSVTIPDNVKEVHEYAFVRCNNLKEVTLLVDLRKFNGSNKFFDCKNIETIKTNDIIAYFASDSRIDSIRRNSFAGSNNLTSLKDTDGTVITTLDKITDSKEKNDKTLLEDNDKISSTISENCKSMEEDGFCERSFDNSSLILLTFLLFTSVIALKVLNNKHNKIIRKK